MKDAPMSNDPREAFETWLASMDFYLDALKAEVPFALDYSLDSLKPLEAWLMDRYPDIAAAKADRAGMVNNAAAYVGEVIRKTSGRGKWQLDDREDSVFRGYPLMVDFRDNDETSPVSLVIASTDRRKGDYLFSVASHLTGG